MEITDGVIQSEGGNIELQHCEKEKKTEKDNSGQCLSECAT